MKEKIMMIDQETVFAWAGLSITGMLALAAVVAVSLFLYDWAKDGVDWRNVGKELKEWAVALVVCQIAVAVIVLVVCVGWPVMAFFIIREELRERGIA